MDEALKLMNLFLMSEEVGYLESRKGDKEILSCPEVPELENLPLVIWVNQGTIGPAEAVAAILREYRKAKILGLLTPGLVAKRDFIALEDGSALLLTSSIFALKSGKSIWGTGLTPDVKIQGQDQSDETYLKETVKLISGP
jgi:C-terminal processing protease CtpA/Prc